MTTLALISSILLVLLNIADAYTTERVLRLGGREANPAMAFIIRYTAPYHWAIKLGLIVAGLWAVWTYSDGIFRASVITLACAPFAWVVGHNARVLARMAAMRV